MATKYNHTINGVSFSIEDNASYSYPKIQNQFGDIQYGDIRPLINAVEIDWNGADWNSVPASITSTINSTGDLLKTIKYAAKVEIVGKLMFAKSLREPHSSQRLAKRYESINR